MWMKLVIPTWRQEELLAWQPLFDICQAKHTRTVYIQHTGNCFKHWLRLEKLTTLHGSNKHYCLHSSCGKQLQNVTNLSSASFLLQHTHTLSQHSPPPKHHQCYHQHPHPSLGPPSAGCMSLEVASDVSSSTGHCANPVGPWWMQSVWETVRCE